MGPRETGGTSILTKILKMWSLMFLRMLVRMLFILYANYVALIEI